MGAFCTFLNQKPAMDSLLERFANENAFVAMGNVMQYSFHRRADGMIENYLSTKAKIFCLSRNFPQSDPVEKEIELLQEELKRVEKLILDLLQEAL